MDPSASLRPEVLDKDPNMLSWAEYLHDSDIDTTSSDSEDDFRGDSLNDADWDGQENGTLPSHLGLMSRLHKTIQSSEDYHPKLRTGNTFVAGSEAEPSSYCVGRGSAPSIYLPQNR